MGWAPNMTTNGEDESNGGETQRWIIITPPNPGVEAEADGRRGPVMVNAIVIGGGVAGLGVIRALGLMGVPVTSLCHKADPGGASKYVQERILYDDPCRALLERASRLSGSVVFPVSDSALIALSKCKEILETHYTIACTEWAITEKIIDKKHTYPLAAAAGIPVPTTKILSRIDEVHQLQGQLTFPYLLKPSQSHLYSNKFKRKMTRVDSYSQLMKAYRQATAARVEMMLQEFIPGPDVNVVNYNAYFWNGEPLVEFTAEHTRNAPPQLGSPRVVRSRPIPEVLDSGRRILGALDFYGFACVEFKKDTRDGLYKLMEVNGRHNLSSSLAVRCGLNFPWIHYIHLTEKRVPQVNNFQHDVYWIDELLDISYSARYWRQERYWPRQYLRPYLKRHVFASLSWRDPKPFFHRVVAVLQSRWKERRGEGSRDFQKHDPLQ